MTTPPFLTFPVRGKRDIVRARQCARQVAWLLQFPITEQACIAAGAFTIACQALAAYGSFVLCFQIEEGQLHVFARRASADAAGARPHNRLAGLSCTDGEAVLRLAKSLPPERTLMEVDIAWLVEHNLNESPGIFEEIVRQNQEVLALLHEIHTLRRQRVGVEAVQPHAA